MPTTNSVQSSKVDAKLPQKTKIFLAIFAAFLALTSWALSSPLGATPDEDYHLVSIWCGQGERPDLCQSGSKQGEVSAPTALIISANCFAFHPENSANCKLPSSTEFSPTTRSNADGGYPPIFYWTMSLFASTDIFSAVVLMRIFNALLFLSLITVITLLSPKYIRFPILAGMAITSIPLGLFLIPSVNPSSWAIISASTLWGGLMGYFRADTTKTKWALFITVTISAFIGSGARSDSAVYACIALVVAGVLSWDEIKKDKKLLLPSLVIIPIALYFYLRSGQSSVASSAAVSHGLNLQLAVSNLTELPSLWVGSLGTWGLGWLDTQMPSIVWVTTIAIFSGFVFVGLNRFDLKKVLALTLLTFSISAIPLYVLVHDNVSVGSGVQPRYVYPLLIMIAGVSLWRANIEKGELSRLQILVAALGLTVANSLALHTNIRRYVSGTDAGGFNLNHNIEWWWQNSPSPMLVWAIGTAAFLLLMLLAVSTLWPISAPRKIKNPV